MVVNKFQERACTYNVRSWLTGISGTNFSESLKYENSSSPQWGGNISVMEWGTSSLQKCYRFGYDALSRLVSAVYSEGLSAGSCSETYSYDRNGNMMSSVRNGETVALTMSGNRVTSAGGTSFVYDSKGREISSGYGTVLATQYNVLDLPQRHTVGGGGTTVDYSYDADGRKVQEKVTGGSSVTIRDYVGEFQYEGGSLKKILFDGGYVDMRALDPIYVFFLRDHLGSVRSVVTENGSVYQTNDYYPFGDLFPDSGRSLALDISGNRFRFSGKELSSETGLYDFSARFLHSRFGRFTTIDPLAEKYPDISPYSYCKGNPVNFIDPDGMREWPVNPNYKGFNRRSEDNFRNPRPNHNGIDINFGSGSDDLGAPVFATHDGIVTRKRFYTDDKDSGGTRIQITSVDGEVSTYYMHLNTIESYQEGDYIEEGTLIGTIGGSGRGLIDKHTPHLHYEIKINGQYMNPSIDKNNLLDPQSLLMPISLGEIEPAIIVGERNSNIINSFDIVLSVLHDVKI